jgi:hypothetical protein
VLGTWHVRGKTRIGFWEDNIKMDLKAIEWQGVDWIDLAQVGTSDGLL